MPRLDSASSMPNAASSSCQGRLEPLRQIFRASHKEWRLNHPVQLGRSWRGDMRFPRRGIGIWMRANGGHVPCAKFSPVGEDGRKGGAGVSRSELEKAMARSAREGIPQALRKLGIEGRRVRSFD